VNKPNDLRRPARRLADLIGPCLAGAFKRHGFASTELVTHWDTIVGAEIAAHSEPLKITWPRQVDADDPEPATLVLRCEGPAAIEIQHQTNVIMARINQFLGWRAIGRVTISQAPLARRPKPRPRPAVDAQEARRLADTMTGIADEDLRAALGRLGAAVKGVRQGE
jgi:hypothetical protein